MRKILFVDDEPNVLDGLRRMLRPMRREWEVTFAAGGEQALAELAGGAFDIIVSDMRMPGMDGAQLLAEVRRRHPHTVRIILSGHSDQEMILRSVGPAHQYLAKPCDAEALKETVGRACALRDLLRNDSLQKLISQMDSLPSLPSVYVELVGELRSPEASVKRAGEIISKDPGMTAKILQLVNSAFFGLRRTVSSPIEAAMLLGLDTITSLVLSVHVFSRYDGTKLRGFSADALRLHCVTVGSLAKAIALAERQERSAAENAFTAGLLHDTGKLVLASTLGERYVEVLDLKKKGDAEVEAERQVLGTTHGEVGAYLLGLWGLPDPIVEAVAFHHQPRQCPSHGFTPLTAVHIADCLVRQPGCAMAHSPAAVLDMDYLSKINLAGRVPAWEEVYISSFEAQE